MEYPFVSTTNAGNTLLASTNGDPNNSLILDKAIFSNQTNSSNKPLEDTTESDFASPLFYNLQAVKHNENTMQPEVTLDNKNFKQDYPVYMIGVLGHAQNDTSGDETLCAIAVASNDPLIMPKATDNDYKCTFALPIGIDRGKDVKIVATDAGTVSYQDFANYQSSANSSLSSTSASASTNSYNISLLSNSVSYNSSAISGDENLMGSNYDVALKASGQASSNADDITTLATSLNSLSNVGDVASGAYALADQANSIAMNIPHDTSSSANESMLGSVIAKANANSDNIDNLQGYVSSFSTIDTKADQASERAKSQQEFIDKVAGSVNDLSNNVNNNTQNISAIQKTINKVTPIQNMPYMYMINHQISLFSLPQGIYIIGNIDLNNGPLYGLLGEYLPPKYLANPNSPVNSIIFTTVELIKSDNELLIAKLTDWSTGKTYVYDVADKKWV